MSVKRKAVKKKQPRYKLPVKEPVMVCVWGFKITTHLAVTPSFTKVGRWTITHIGSGYSVDDNQEFPTGPKAAKAAEEIERLDIPWAKLVARNPEHNRKVVGEKNYEKITAIVKRYSK